MTRRRGMTLVELIAALPILMAVFVLSSALFPSLVLEVPRMQRVVNTGSGLSHLARAVQRDMASAISLPTQCGVKAAGPNTLLMGLPGKTICYQVGEGEVVRSELPAGHAEQELVTGSWSLSQSKVGFELWRQDERPYAVVLRTSVTYVTQGRELDKLANAKVYFLGGLAKGATTR